MENVSQLGEGMYRNCFVEGMENGEAQRHTLEVIYLGCQQE